MPSRKPLATKWLGVAVAAVIVWAVIGGLVSRHPDHRVPSTAQPPPTTPASPGSSVPTSLTEYFWADQPTSPSYSPTYGARYDRVWGFLGSVDAKITRNGPGDYTVDFPDVPAGTGSAQISAYASPSTCYSPELDATGAYERIHVICMNIGIQAPSAYIGPLAGVNVDSPFAVAIYAN